MIVCATTARTPAASTAPASPASTSSMRSTSRKSAYAFATPAAFGSMPSDAIMRSAGPLIVFPPTSGLIPTTRAVVSFSAARTPRTASNGPMLTIGLLGATITTSDVRIASITPAAGRATSTPSNRTPITSSCVRRFTKYSWNGSSPASVETIVRTRASVTGRIANRSPNACAIDRVASESEAPSCSICVR